MTSQSEQLLENNLIEQLKLLGYHYIVIKDENELLVNLKSQLELHNNIQLSEKEFSSVLNILNKGSVFEKAKVLREKQHIFRDNGDSLYFEFISIDNWCQNQFQVTNQVTIEGKYKNRYDVTLLINGLPLVQIELKRRGIELKEAFNQTNRYQHHSYGASIGLFQFIQLFIISNGVNTKYYANNKHQSFKQTFYWSDENNKLITQLNDFVPVFMEPCHLSKMICRYVVLSESKKILMVLRPYQYFAVESLIERVKNSTKNGYIWHTTGSGKTLTSFKASQILTNMPQVKKVVFVVDRKDLDYQTTKEFNSFSQGSIDGTENTKALVGQFSDDTKLIVTTIQKLNSAISKAHHQKKMELLRDEKIVFIFDECHRSQFGETHKKIRNYFSNTQMFGFTGTPIFAENAVKSDGAKSTTKELFEECLHKYVITDAIKDENVLKFSVEYIGRYKRTNAPNSEIDIEVEAIDKEELMTSDDRIDKISNYIIANHGYKTHNKDFTAIFCTSGIDVLRKYYDAFNKKKNEGKHKLKVATIFSYAANEEDKDANGLIPDDLPDDGGTVNIYNREALEEYIGHYNQMFSTNYTSKDSDSFYKYYNDISKRVKNREIDILLVVNMYLTGFDSPTLNTLYVDKNLKYHGLIQAFSRTNRILNEKKSQGNIVCFRNLKIATDKAITLFSNKNAIEDIIIQPYEVYLEKFKVAYKNLLKIAPTVDSVNDLADEEKVLEYVKAFREIIRLKNILVSFSDHNEDNLPMPEQEFLDYKSKYLDIHESIVPKPGEKVSILNDVDFELELIQRDEINVAYILRLLSQLVDSKNKGKDHKFILDIISGNAELRSKKELIDKFIKENLQGITDSDNVEEEFEKFWRIQQSEEFNKLCKEEGLNEEKLENVISEYLYTEREPLRDELLEMIDGTKPKILERKVVGERLLYRIKKFISTFIDGMS